MSFRDVWIACSFAVSSVLLCCVWPSPRGSANIQVEIQQTPLRRPSLLLSSLLAPSLAPFKNLSGHLCKLESQIGDCFTALLVLCRGVGASPCSGLSWRPLFVVLSPWAGSRSRLVLALGLRRAVAPRKGNCWVRIDLAILGLLAQAIVIEIRNASLDFNCH